MTLAEHPVAAAPTERIVGLKERMLDEPRYLSIEQALIVTDVYQSHEGDSAARKRALADAALADAGGAAAITRDDLLALLS